MGIWISGKSMEYGRWFAAGARVGDRIYCSGGIDASVITTPGSAIVESTMEVYDIPTDTWEVMIMPGSKACHEMVVWDGRLYLLGGLSRAVPTDEVWIYDTATDSWANAAPMPIGMHVFSAECVNGKIYCMAGRNVNSHNVGTGWFQIYDIETDMWEASKTMEVVCGTSSATIDGKIYLFGGWNGAAMNTVRIYDPEIGQWSAKQAMNNTHVNAATIAKDSLIYLMGGASTPSQGDAAVTFEVYDSATDSWATMPDSLPRNVSAACSAYLDGRIYLFSGGNGSSFSNRMDIYIPEDTLTVTCRYQDQNGKELLPDSETQVTAGDPFAAEAASISGYAFTGSRVDDSAPLPEATVTIERVLRNHVITFLYKADGVTQLDTHGCVQVEVKIKGCSNNSVMNQIFDVLRNSDCDCDCNCCCD